MYLLTLYFFSQSSYLGEADIPLPHTSPLGWFAPLQIWLPNPYTLKNVKQRTVHTTIGWNFIQFWVVFNQ